MATRNFGQRSCGLRTASCRKLRAATNVTAAKAQVNNMQKHQQTCMNSLAPVCAIDHFPRMHPARVLPFKNRLSPPT